MRARNIKPAFFKNEDLSDVPFEGRLLFAGLWCLADCEGRLEDRPKLIKAEVFPHDDMGSSKVHLLLQQLADKGFIGRYQVGEKRYIQVTNFKRHQTPHLKEKQKGSQIPPFQGDDPAQEIPAPVRCQSGASPKNTGASPADILIPDVLNPDILIPDSANGVLSPGELRQLPLTAEDPFSEFQALFRGEFPGDTWRAFMEHVNSPERLELLRRNAPLWMDTRKYQDGFGKDAKWFLKSEIWLRAPPPAKEQRESREAQLNRVLGSIE